METVYNKIPVYFSGNRVITGPPINYQYDVVQFMLLRDFDLPDYCTVDFCNAGDPTTKPMPCTSGVVQIPDEFLLTGRKVKAFIVITGEDEGASETRFEITIPVRGRPQRTDIAPTPAEQLVIDQILEALNDGKNRAESAATLAESYAVGGTGTREGEDRDNAKHYADLAREGASSAGWVDFYIDENGYLHYVKTVNADLDFYIDENGFLHVTNGV